MREVPVAALLGMAAALTGVLAFELRAVAVNDQAATAAPAPLRLPSRPAAAPPAIVREAQQKASAAILARPLFSSSRRPTAAAMAKAAPPAILPRLAGTIIHGVDRSVIFVPAGGGKPVVAHEGAEVGGYTVQAIQAGRVTLAGPDGVHVLRPTFDPQHSAASTRATTVGTPALPPGAAGPASLNLQGLRSLPGYAGLNTPPQAGSAR